MSEAAPKLGNRIYFKSDTPQHCEHSSALLPGRLFYRLSWPQPGFRKLWEVQSGYLAQLRRSTDKKNGGVGFAEAR